jgi:hypothetical protein
MIKTVKIENPENLNMILGQSHFIKTVEDLHEALVNTVPGIEFGLAFSEASGPCLIRKSGTNEELTELAVKNLLNLKAGHSFIIFLKNAFPINVLQRIKNVPEIVNIYCATANPVEVVVYEGENGNAILGVIDGFAPKGVESDEDIKKRKEFLRNIGYKM